MDTSGTIRITIQRATIRESFDAFGKMVTRKLIDPFVVVTFNGEQRRSATHQSGDVNPDWNEVMEFRRTNELSAKIQLFEEDQGKTDDFIGRKNISILQCLIHQKKINWFCDMVLNGHSKAKLYYSLEFISDNKYFCQEKDYFRNQLIVSNISSSFIKDLTQYGAEEPYIRFIKGSDKFQTSTVKSPTKDPSWQDILIFRVDQQKEIKIEIANKSTEQKDKILATGVLNIFQLSLNSQKPESVQIYQNTDLIGELYLVCEKITLFPKQSQGLQVKDEVGQQEILLVPGIIKNSLCTDFSPGQPVQPSKQFQYLPIRTEDQIKLEEEQKKKEEQEIALKLVQQEEAKKKEEEHKLQLEQQQKIEEEKQLQQELKLKEEEQKLKDEEEKKILLQKKLEQEKILEEKQKIEEQKLAEQEKRQKEDEEKQKIIDEEISKRKAQEEQNRQNEEIIEQLKKEMEIQKAEDEEQQKVRQQLEKLKEQYEMLILKEKEKEEQRQIEEARRQQEERKFRQEKARQEKQQERLKMIKEYQEKKRKEIEDRWNQRIRQSQGAQEQYEKRRGPSNNHGSKTSRAFKKDHFEEDQKLSGKVGEGTYGNGSKTARNIEQSPQDISQDESLLISKIGSTQNQWRSSKTRSFQSTNKSYKVRSRYHKEGEKDDLIEQFEPNDETIEGHAQQKNNNGNNEGKGKGKNLQSTARFRGNSLRELGDFTNNNQNEHNIDRMLSKKNSSDDINEHNHDNNSRKGDSESQSPKRSIYQKQYVPNQLPKFESAYTLQQRSSPKAGFPQSQRFKEPQQQSYLYAEQLLNLPSIFENQTKNVKGFTFGQGPKEHIPLWQIKNGREIPGPGTYIQMEPKMVSQKGFSFGVSRDSCQALGYSSSRIFDLNESHNGQIGEIARKSSDFFEFQRERNNHSVLEPRQSQVIAPGNQLSPLRHNNSMSPNASGGSLSPKRNLDSNFNNISSSVNNNKRSLPKKQLFNMQDQFSNTVNNTEIQNHPIIKAYHGSPNIKLNIFPVKKNHNFQRTSHPHNS